MDFSFRGWHFLILDILLRYPICDIRVSLHEQDMGFKSFGTKRIDGLTNLANLLGGFEGIVVRDKFLRITKMLRNLFKNIRETEIFFSFFSLTWKILEKGFPSNPYHFVKIRGGKKELQLLGMIFQVLWKNIPSKKSIISFLALKSF